MNVSPQRKASAGAVIRELAQRPIQHFSKYDFRGTAYLWLCFLIPALTVILIYFARGHHPIGNSSVLVLDLGGQYVWFFDALRDMMNGDSELLYSFARSLGGDFVGIFAYYVASPLSLLVCLFPPELTLEGLLVLFAVKAGLCGVTFGYYMHKTERLRNKLSIILFAICYALSSYAIVQQHNTMWIDAVIWLPLITLGIEEIVKFGKFKRYVICFSLALISNFYIGYMLCIYCAVYFFICYFSNTEHHQNNPFREKFHLPRSLVRILFYSILSLGIAAFILLGAYYSLNFGKSTFTNPNWDWTIKFDLIDFLYKLLPGSYDTVRPAGLPFVYCGVLTLLLIPSYFLSKRYSMQQKILSGVLILFFFASFVFSVPDLIWHLFQKPVWLNYRYSFMLTFVLCVLACRAFSDLEELSLKVTAGVGGLIALFCVILQQHTSGDYVDPDDYTCIFFTLLALFIYLATLAILKKAVDRKVTSVALVAIVTAEVFLNGLWSLNSLGADVGYTTYSAHNDFLNKVRPIVDQVQESDTSFYRMEKTFFRRTNDNMALDMRGLSGSTSTLNKETIAILEKMGYAAKSHWSKYLGGTPVNDSLLGVKYVISPKNVYADYYDPYKTDDKNGYTAYLNPYALSIAYGVSDDVLSFPLGYREETDAATTNEKGNVITDAVSALKGFLNNWLQIEEMNATYYEDIYDSPLDRLNAMVSAMLGEKETLQIFKPIEYKDTYTDNLMRATYAGYTEVGYSFRDTDADPSKEVGTVSFTVTMPVSGELYFFAPSDYPKEVKLSLSTVEAGETDSSDNLYDNNILAPSTGYGTFNGNETTRIISLDSHGEGDKVTLHLRLNKNNFFVKKDAPCFYYIDWALFEDAFSRLAANQMKISSYTESSFDGTLTTAKNNQLIMTSLPYDNGWQVYVNGEKVELEKAFGAFVSFYSGEKAGELSIRMEYRPQAFYVGAILSGICIGLFLILCFLDRHFHFGCRDRRTEEERIEDAAYLVTKEAEELPPPEATPVSAQLPPNTKSAKRSRTESSARFRMRGKK